MVTPVIGFASLFVLAASATDWPQWRGPQRNGISRDTGLLQDWPKGGPMLRWQVNDIGYGYSTPAVVGSHLYLISNKGNDDEFVQARSVKDGGHVWSQRLGKVGSLNQLPPDTGARSTPTMDGALLYALRPARTVPPTSPRRWSTTTWSTALPGWAAAVWFGSRPTKTA